MGGLDHSNHFDFLLRYLPATPPYTNIYSSPFDSHHNRWFTSWKKGRSNRPQLWHHDLQFPVFWPLHDDGRNEFVRERFPPSTTLNYLLLFLEHNSN